METRSIGSRCVRDNTWIARAFSVVCSVCWVSYRDKSFQSIDSLLWSSWSYFIYELNSEALVQPVSNASELAFKWVEDVWLFIKREREREKGGLVRKQAPWVFMNTLLSCSYWRSCIYTVLIKIAACIKNVKGIFTPKWKLCHYLIIMMSPNSHPPI